MNDIEADELQSLIDDIRATKVEKEFESNFARVEMYHLIGERITNDRIYKRDGAKVFVTVTQETKIKQRNLYRAVQFYEKCKDLSTLPYGKDVSWHKICNEYLTNPKDKEEPVMCVCPDCGREHRKATE
jgi:hypothetical protein